MVGTEGRTGGKDQMCIRDSINVQETDGSQRILIATHDGQVVCFDETDVRAMGRTAVGVRGIRLREGDYVVGAARAEAGKTVLSITAVSYTHLDVYKRQI